jgi:hypothetical protein
MLCRSAVRRPSRRLLSSFFFLALLPLLSGGKAHQPAHSFSESVLISPDSAAFWLFLDETSWEGFGASGAGIELPGRIRIRSEWLHAVSLEVPTGRISELKGLPGVTEVIPVRRLRRGPESPSEFWAGEPPSGRPATHPRAPQRVAPADSTYGSLGPFLDVLEIPEAHSLGFLGGGTRVGILDGYFLTDHFAFQGNPPVAVRDFVDSDASVDPGLEELPGAASHGTGLWSLVTGHWPGNIIGSAPGASVVLARIRSESDPVGADEDRWVAALEWLESQGARVVLSGVGFRNFDGGVYGQDDLNGDVAPATRAADEAALRGVLVIAPVGNQGPGLQTLQSPADGDSVLAVGASNLSGVEADFSAQGPTEDGRAKPDFLSPGVSVPAASGTGREALGVVEGTEFAGAFLAGAAALFVEAYPERGPMEVLRAFRNVVENAAQGLHRIPRVAPAIVFPDGVWPSPLQDVDSEGRVQDLAPRFDWNVPTTHPLGLPVTYLLEFAEDSLFQGVILRDSVVGTFARTLKDPLPPESRLFWRIRARSTQGISWATRPEGPILVPSWVSLNVLNDPSGTQVAEPQPDFRWTPMKISGAAGPLTFDLEVILDREGEVIQSYMGIEENSFQVEEPLPFNLPLRWRVIAQARTGAVDTVTSSGPFVITSGANPPVTILYQNFPNPFPNPSDGIWETRVWFDLATASTVELAVYDMRGRLVRNLIPGRGCGPVELSPGLYGRETGPPPEPCTSFTWDGSDNGGGRASPGVYLLRLQAGGVTEVRRVVFWP